MMFAYSLVFALGHSVLSRTCTSDGHHAEEAHVLVLWSPIIVAILIITSHINCTN